MKSITNYIFCLGFFQSLVTASLFGGSNSEPKEFLTLYASSKIAIPTVTKEVFVTEEALTETVLHTQEIFVTAPTVTLEPITQTVVKTSPTLVTTTLTKTIEHAATKTFQSPQETVFHTPQFYHRQYESTNARDLKDIPPTYTLHKRLVTELLVENLTSNNTTIGSKMPYQTYSKIYTNNAAKNSFLAGIWILIVSIISIIF